MDTRIRFPLSRRYWDGEGREEREREGLIISQPGWVIAQFNFSRESEYLMLLFWNVRKSIKIPGNFIQLGYIRTDEYLCTNLILVSPIIAFVRLHTISLVN